MGRLNLEFSLCFVSKAKHKQKQELEFQEHCFHVLEMSFSTIMFTKNNRYPSRFEA